MAQTAVAPITFRDQFQNLVRDKTNLARIKNSLAGVIDHKRFLNVMLGLYGQRSLQEVPPQDFLMACLRLASLGLDPSLGHAAPIPFKEKGRAKLEIVIMEQGYRELAYRSGKYSYIYGDVVYQSEVKNGSFEYVRGSTNFLRHSRPLDFNPDGQQLIGAYAVATRIEDPATAAGFVVLPRAEVLRHRSYSKSYAYAEREDKKDSTWHTEEAQMWIKTAIRVLCGKHLQKSAEMRHAHMVDGVDPDKIQDKEIIDLTAQPVNGNGEELRASEEAPQAKPDHLLINDFSDQERKLVKSKLGPKYGFKTDAQLQLWLQKYEGSKADLLEEANRQPAETKTSGQSRSFGGKG